MARGSVVEWAARRDTGSARIQPSCCSSTTKTPRHKGIFPRIESGSRLSAREGHPHFLIHAELRDCLVFEGAVVSLCLGGEILGFSGRLRAEAYLWGLPGVKRNPVCRPPGIVVPTMRG